MIKLGIIGYPLLHSLSPVMQNAALQEKGIDGDYQLLETPPKKLKMQVEFLKTSGFRGFNVTIPHKVAIMKLLDNIDEFAVKVGAVNTVVIGDNQELTGYNTDVYGFIQAIPVEIRENLSRKRAAIFGSGGAARAVIAGVYELGIREISLFARNKEQSDELIEALSNNFKDLKVNYTSLQENVDMSEVSLVVNTTPLGMQGNLENISPLNSYSLDSLDKDALVYDIVYRPKKTKLLKIAQGKGFKTQEGLDMLILQGAKGFHLWTGAEPNIEAMKKAILLVI